MDIIESINRYLAGSPANRGERTRLIRARDEIARLRTASQETINGRTVQIDWKAQALELRELVRLNGIKIAELEAALSEKPAPVAKPHEQEPVSFLANGTRFKMSFFDCAAPEGDEHGESDVGTYVTCFEAFAKELDGRWVALVAAEDDCHLNLTSPQPEQQEPVGVKFNEGLWQEREARIAQLEAELIRMQGRELKLQLALAEQPAQRSMSDMKFGGCPSCGSQSCVAGQCQRPAHQEPVAIADGTFNHNPKSQRPAQQEPVAWGKPSDEMVQAATDEYDEWASDNKGTTECIRAMLAKALKASQQPAQQEPGAGEGKEFSERLKLCARNVAFVAAGASKCL